MDTPAKPPGRPPLEPRIADLELKVKFLEGYTSELEGKIAGLEEKVHNLSLMPSSAPVASTVQTVPGRIMLHDAERATWPK